MSNFKAMQAAYDNMEPDNSLQEKQDNLDRYAIQCFDEIIEFFEENYNEIYNALCNYCLKEKKPLLDIIVSDIHDFGDEQEAPKIGYEYQARAIYDYTLYKLSSNRPLIEKEISEYLWESFDWIDEMKKYLMATIKNLRDYK